MALSLFLDWMGRQAEEKIVSLGSALPLVVTVAWQTFSTRRSFPTTQNRY
jgi:hypothetical protein